MDQIIEEIKGNHTTRLNLLEKLTMLSNLERNSILKLICDALKVNKSIKQVILSCNQIDAIGVEYICEALKINTTINSLFIGNNQIGDIGAKYISDLLKINSTINELYLAYTKIGDMGAKYIW